MNAVALNIIKAQCYSDEAKGIYHWLQDEFNITSTDRCYCYGQKDLYIIKAINGILSGKNRDIRFYVTKCTEINSYLVYFNFKIGAERRQISFHSFNNKLNRYLNGSQPCKTHWDKKSSRDAAIELWYMLGG